VKPFENVFSSATFRRVILPGIILAAGIHPLIMKFILVVESLYGISALGMLVSEVVLFGLAVSIATQRIFYVYEGFRLPWLTKFALHANERRVEKLIALQELRAFVRLSHSASLGLLPCRSPRLLLTISLNRALRRAMWGELHTLLENSCS
jgi:hypothetical protein